MNDEDGVSGFRKLPIEELDKGRIFEPKPKLNGKAHDDRPRYVVDSFDDFVSADFPPRENVLAPFLKTQSFVLVASWRGVGKTQFDVGMALAVATGTDFLKFAAPKPRSVLFVDGEMPGNDMQERLISAANRLPCEVRDLLRTNFRLLSHERQLDPMQNINTPVGQRMIEDALGDSELLILDNLSTLFRPMRGTSNDEESWLEAQEYFLRLRRGGKTVVLVKHTGKDGSTPRGTSKHEDIADAVVLLKQPENYRKEQGARFVVSFEKARGFYGDDAMSFEAWLDDGIWSCSNAAEPSEVKLSDFQAAVLKDAIDVLGGPEARDIRPNEGMPIVRAISRDALRVRLQANGRLEADTAGVIILRDRGRLRDALTALERKRQLYSNKLWIWRPSGGNG